MIQMVVIGATAAICLGVIYTLYSRERAARAQGCSSCRPNSSNGARRNVNVDVAGHLRRRNFRKNSESDIDCVICLEAKPEVEIYPCKHQILCEKCINLLICASKKSCPVCRSDIKGYSVIGEA